MPPELSEEEEKAGGDDRAEGGRATGALPRCRSTDYYRRWQQRPEIEEVGAAAGPTVRRGDGGAASTACATGG
jgi:hypothetical protein